MHEFVLATFLTILDYLGALHGARLPVGRLCGLEPGHGVALPSARREKRAESPTNDTTKINSRRMTLELKFVQFVHRSVCSGAVR